MNGGLDGLGGREKGGDAEDGRLETEVGSVTSDDLVGEGVDGMAAWLNREPYEREGVGRLQDSERVSTLVPGGWGLFCGADVILLALAAGATRLSAVGSILARCEVN